MLYKKNHHSNKVTCLLCPHKCELSNGQVGKCLVRSESGGKIVSNNSHLLSAVAIEPIEKKPFKHWLPHTRTLSVGGYGCPLDCAFCLPPDTLISTPSGPKRIDQIQDGEEIFALDSWSNDPQLVLAHVGHVFDREAEEVIAIEVNGGMLELTPEHPVMTKNRRWVKAEDLTSDDEVLCVEPVYFPLENEKKM